MKKTLHILLRPEDDLARLVIEQPSGGMENRGVGLNSTLAVPKIGVFDLTIPNPDYKGLVHAIFDAEIVAVW
jgi:hypothetical protein